jgi:hypothetical protein
MKDLILVDPETVSDYIVLDGYDGPLLEIARVDFTEVCRMVQVRSLCTFHEIEQPPGERLRGSTSGKKPWTRTVIRLTRDNLQAMLNLLDDKPTVSIRDEW